MIQPKHSNTEIRKLIEQRFTMLDEAIISRFSYIGETFVKNARENGTYNDITGNLRSSIGYIVLKNGKQKAGGGFEKYSNGSKGQTSGKKFLKEISVKFPSGYVLIVVAGMQYAAAVESRGKDVLTGSSIVAKQELKRAFQRFKKL
ncbi:hypothetical protein [Daejeonella sp. H1SJ63]|uniref:hypothetical protein n=1 Tax=Daejeonella sp. H1SJ63 TaxID=3034145 RepID=UPI0023EC44B0|nr:hypothetical protein [Daejeonella sp. H1SJ63]